MDVQKERDALIASTVEMLIAEARQEAFQVDKGEVDSFIRSLFDEAIQFSCKEVVKRPIPVKFDPSRVYHLTSLMGQPYSIKFTNLTLNLKQIMKSIFRDALLLTGGAEFDAHMEKFLTGQSALSVPFFGILFALRNIAKGTGLKVTKQMMIALGAMWQACDDNNQVKQDGLLDVVNKALVKFGEHPIRQVTLDKILDDLENLKAIEGVETLQGKWLLKETVSSQFVSE
ncbi:MAG TPA: hypothetical protein VF538_15115 [Pyrinomonadaceae bacterium]|jgi:hypothetical protein